MSKYTTFFQPGQTKIPRTWQGIRAWRFSAGVRPARVEEELLPAYESERRPEVLDDQMADVLEEIKNGLNFYNILCHKNL